MKNINYILIGTAPADEPESKFNETVSSEDVLFYCNLWIEQLIREFGDIEHVAIDIKTQHYADRSYPEVAIYFDNDCNISHTLAMNISQTVKSKWDTQSRRKLKKYKNKITL